MYLYIKGGCYPIRQQRFPYMARHTEEEDLWRYIQLYDKHYNERL